MGVRDRRIKHKNGTVSVMRYITWYLPGGKAVTRSLGPAALISKTRAKQILADIKTDIRKKKYNTADPLLSEYVLEYIEYTRYIQRKRSWDRERGALKNVVKELGEYKLSEITPEKLIKYQGIRLSKGIMPGTINLELAFLKRMYNIANLQDKFQDKNPVMQIKFLHQEDRPERILSLKEERRLLQASPEHIANIIICALNTGMRRGEMLSLKWDKVNLEHGYIILESALTKTKKTRRVSINSILKNLLIKLESNKQSDYVFTNEHGKEYSNINSLVYLFNTSLKRADIKGFRFHDLRHTAATRMIEAGVPLFAVGQILGHSNPKTTMRYAHPDQSLKDGLEALASYNLDNHSDTKGLYKAESEPN